MRAPFADLVYEVDVCFRSFLNFFGRGASIVVGTSPNEPGAPIPTPVQAGDRMLLSSDGVHDALRDDEIRAILRQDLQPAAQCDELVGAALQAGSQDNLTALVVHVLEVGSEAWQ
jgi:hypothetical protein